LALVAFVFSAGCSEPTSAGQAALEKYLGKNFAGVKVQTLDGQQVVLRDELKGKPVILNVWATWCAPCIEELPSLDALGQQGKYAVVAIATDKDAAGVQAYLRKNHLGAGMTVLWDSLGMVTTGEVGARVLPASYVLDPNGTVKLVAAGAREWVHPKMQAKIEQALK
jgi:thiol-disulfide isomerase/thioredoxin